VVFDLGCRLESPEELSKKKSKQNFRPIKSESLGVLLFVVIFSSSGNLMSQQTSRESTLQTAW
jgi:hypothetical protein